MTIQTTVCGCLLVVALASSARAQVAPANTPAALPDLAVPAQELGDPNNFVLFFKPGVTYDQARSDLTFCWQYLVMGAPRPIPGFVPWPMSEAVRQDKPQVGQFGLVGSLIGAAIAGPVNRSLRQGRIYRCMLPRGYERYRTSQAVWTRLNTGDDAVAIDAQARIASGPVPPTPKVQP